MELGLLVLLLLLGAAMRPPRAVPQWQIALCAYLTGAYLWVRKHLSWTLDSYARYDQAARAMRTGWYRTEMQPGWWARDCTEKPLSLLRRGLIVRVLGACALLKHPEYIMGRDAHNYPTVEDIRYRYAWHLCKHLDAEFD